MTPEQELQLARMQNPPMEGWCTHEKACVLFKLVEDHKPEICVEIGVFGGRSVIALASGCKAVGKGIVFGIDPWNVPACLEGQNDEPNNSWWASVPWDKVIREYYHKLQEYDLLEYTSHFRLHDTQCLKFFNENSIDMIHFDSNHSEEVSCRTVRDWWPKLKNGAIIIMDDIDWEGQAKSVGVMRELGIEDLADYQRYAVYRKRSQ